MRIVGEWLRCDDGITRPTVQVEVDGRDGRRRWDAFLVDSGADRTVFSVDLLRQLRLSGDPSSPDAALLGVGGDVSFVPVKTVIRFATDDGRPASIRGEFAAFIESQALDLSILGRDVLDNFDVIISRRRDEMLLLAPNHTYHVSPV